MAFYHPDQKRNDDNTIITTSLEKGHADVYEHQPSNDDIDKGPLYSDKDTARLLRKMDLNIVPFLSLLYLWGSFSSTFTSYYLCFWQTIFPRPK